MRLRHPVRLVFEVLFFLVLLSLPSLVAANHSWGNYHWARSSNPFTLKLGDNVSGVWDTHLLITSADWSVSTMLDTVIVSGANTAMPKRCKPVAGRVEVCNARFGFNGWLGLAQIWVSSSHITQGTTKLNDSYFSAAPYNQAAWRNLVMCQEVGHTLGLDHQDEVFDNVNLGSCMDYTNYPETNQHPNAHDYEELEIIYGHLDSTTTIASLAAAHYAGLDVDMDLSREWGRLVKSSHGGRHETYERDLGHGRKVFTFVTWAF